MARRPNFADFMQSRGVLAGASPVILFSQPLELRLDMKITDSRKTGVIGWDYPAQRFSHEKLNKVLNMSDNQQVMALIQGGQWQQAKETCERLCQASANDAELWFSLAGINARLGAMGEVVACCQKVISLQPGHGAAHYNLGVALQHLGRHDEALAAYRQVILQEPRHAQAYANLGMALRTLGRNEEAVENCRKAIEIQPNLVEAINTLGLVALDAGNLPEAETFFCRAIAQSPGYAEAHFNLGCTASLLAKNEHAATCFRRAIELRPNYVEAHRRLSAELEGLGRHADAAESLRKVVKMQPDNAGAWTMLGSVCEMLDQVDEAMSAYLRAAVLQPDFAMPHLALGILFQKKGMYDEAKEQYRHTLRLDPDIATARYFLSALGEGESPAQSPPRYIETLFNDCAEKFDKHLVQKLGYQIPDLLNNTVRKVLGNTTKKIDVLDLGCGTGLGGALFRDIAQRLTGVDLSHKMIEQARQRAVYDELIVGDVMLPLSTPGAAFDLIIACDVFIYVGDLANVFAACARVLKSGGLFAFSTEREDACESYLLRKNGRYAHFSGYIKGLAKAARLVEVVVDDVAVRTENGKPVAGNIYIFRK